jgi:hypothetical protein
MAGALPGTCSLIDNKNGMSILVSPKMISDR